MATTDLHPVACSDTIGPLVDQSDPKDKAMKLETY